MTEEVEKGKSLSEQLREDVSINDADLDGCMTEQASLYAHYASLYSKAAYDANRAKVRSDIARAKAYKELRNRFIAKGTKYTEALLESEVTLHPDYIEAQEVYNKYKWAEMMAKEALEALKQRRDMLVQKGKSTLEERKGELYLKGKINEESPEERRNRIATALEKRA